MVSIFLVQKTVKEKKMSVSWKHSSLTWNDPCLEFLFGFTCSFSVWVGSHFVVMS